MKRTIKRSLGIHFVLVLMLHLISFAFLMMTLDLAFSEDKREKLFPGIDLKEFKQ